MPPRWAYRQFIHGLDVDKAFEPAQHALTIVMAKWLSTLTIEERKRVRGIQVTFDSPEGDTFTAKLVSWEEPDATTDKPNPAGSDATPAAVSDGKGVRAGQSG